jgi:hypothetical protein
MIEFILPSMKWQTLSGMGSGDEGRFNISCPGSRTEKNKAAAAVSIKQSFA